MHGWGGRVVAYKWCFCEGVGVPCGVSYMVWGVRMSRVSWRGGGGERSGSHVVSTMWVSNGCIRRGDGCGSSGSG